MIWNLEVPVTKKQPYHSTKSQYEKQFEYWKKYRKIPCNFIGFSLRDMWFISICGTGQFCVKLVSHDINFTLTQVLDANSTIP